MRCSTVSKVLMILHNPTLSPSSKTKKKTPSKNGDIIKSEINKKKNEPEIFLLSLPLLLLLLLLI